MSDGPDNDDLGEPHVKKEPCSTRAGPFFTSAPVNREEGVLAHDLNGRSNTGGESNVPLLISPERASPVHARRYSAMDYVDPRGWGNGARAEPERDSGFLPAFQSQAQFASCPSILQRIEHTAASGGEPFSPSQGHVPFASFPTIHGPEHAVDSGREHNEEPVTEDPPYDPENWNILGAMEAFMAATSSEESPAQQNGSPDLGPSVPKINLTLMDADGLSEFTQWAPGETHKLNLDLRNAQAAGKSQQYKHRVVEMMIGLLRLQKACFGFEEELRRDQAREG